MVAPLGRSQQLTPGTLISLFDINFSGVAGGVGNGIYHFTPGNLGDRKPIWKGITYEPLPIVADGFEKNGRGSQPTPTLSIPATQLIIASVIGLDDLRRAKVTRWQVYEDNLDNGGVPWDSYYPPEVYFIQQKVRHNTQTGIIEWELSTGLDMWGEELPRRVATQRTCLWEYRHWSGSSFSYETATCPYSGNNLYDVDGNPVADPRKDQCGKSLDDCKLRFGVSSPLPMGAFPGLSNAR